MWFMPIGRPVPTIELTAEEEQKLRLIANRPKTSQRDALRAKIVLRASEGGNEQSHSKRVGSNKSHGRKMAKTILGRAA